MKKILTALIVLLTLALPLTACDKTPVSNGLMANASPSTSALTVYSYKGDTVSRSHIFDAPAINSLIAELDAVKAVKTDEWTLDDITVPIYGFEIGKTDGFSIRAAWSNNYWITDTGDVYKFKFNMAELFEKYPGKDARKYINFTIMPNAYYLTQDENGWSDTLLKPISELTPPEDITMTLKSWDKDKVTVCFTNNGDTEWMFGEHFGLMVDISGVWHSIPTTPDNWGFNDIGYILPPGETREKEYLLIMYGDLPAGTYRLSTHDLTVEHTIS